MLVGFDLETNGLDVYKADIIEIGAVVWDETRNIPVDFFNSFGHPDTVISEEITELTGITEDDLKTFGDPEMLTHFLAWLLHVNPQYLVAHNGRGFDIPVLSANLREQGYDPAKVTQFPLIDTMEDLPFKRMPQSMKLAHLALDAGFINPFPHRALTDTLTTMKVLSQFDLDEILEYRKIPNVIVRALVGYNDRQLAKDKKFRWEQLGEDTFPKMWVKKIKETELKEFKEACAFKIGVLKMEVAPK